MDSLLWLVQNCDMLSRSVTKVSSQEFNYEMVPSNFRSHLSLPHRHPSAPVGYSEMKVEGNRNFIHVHIKNSEYAGNIIRSTICQIKLSDVSHILGMNEWWMFIEYLSGHNNFTKNYAAQRAIWPQDRFFVPFNRSWSGHISRHKPLRILFK